MTSPKDREPTEATVRHMVDRFLMWKLPDNFHPDAGISFKPEFNVEYNASRGKPPQRHEPIGTNLFSAEQADAMVRYMLEGLPAMVTASPPVDHGRVEKLIVGTPVRCLADNCPGEWREDWRDWTGFVAGIHYEPRVGLNFTVSDKWPPESNGDLSDGFREGQLAALTNKDTA